MHYDGSMNRATRSVSPAEDIRAGSERGGSLWASTEQKLNPQILFPRLLL
jgi:hypothetical protein